MVRLTPFTLLVMATAVAWIHASPVIEQRRETLHRRTTQAEFQSAVRKALPSGIDTPLGELPVCVPSQLTAVLGLYPESAVTTKQTGTGCTRYGNPPRPVVGAIESPTGLEDAVQVCQGEFVHFTDSFGEERTACYYANPKSSKEKPLPLLVYLHPSLFTTTITFPMTGLGPVRDTQALNDEDPSRLGFSYILPFGRNTKHFYPIPDQVGLGWDNWYRNFDRTDPQRNPDVDLIDQSIAFAKSKVPVDDRRVFMTGWSNGAAMAMLYALNTKGIASASVYSAPDPYRDIHDPCMQVPNPPFKTPIQDIHNKCDVFGICTTGKNFYDDLHKRYPSLQNSIVIIDPITEALLSKDEQATCDKACQGTCGLTTGTLAHLRWPTLRNSDTVFDFLRRHPLPENGA